MPRKSKWPNVKKYTNRHGNVYYYHRPSGTRIRGEYESAEWILHYNMLEQRHNQNAINTGNAKNGTVDHMIHHFKTTHPKWTLGKYANSTMDDYKRAMRDIHNYIGAFYIEDIKAEEVREMIRVHASIKSKRTGKPRTRNADYLKAVYSVIWNFAKDSNTTFPQLEAKQNPTESIEDLHVVEHGYRKWPEELVQIIFSDLPKYSYKKDKRGHSVPISAQSIVRLIKFTYYTGQRIDDVISTQWTQYEEPYLRYTQKKTKKPMLVYIQAELREEMNKWRLENDVHFLNPKHDSRFVLKTITGRAWTKSNAQHRWCTLRKQIEHHPRLLEYKARNPDFDITNYSLHGLRRNATVNLLQKLANKEGVKAVTGHASDRMVDWYAKEMDQQVQSRNAVQRLEQKKI